MPISDAAIPGTTVHRTIGLLYNALIRLHAVVDDGIVERIGVMIHRAMSTQQRYFHTPEHIFDLADPNNPHTTLAALFHDLVYYQVDDGLTPEIAEILDPYITVDKNSVRIRSEISPKNRAFHGCAGVFGFKEGQELSPFGGLNEFLSALVMDTLLVSLVSDRDLLIATAGIEATIPFRGADSRGLRPPERLAARISQVNKTFNLGLSDDEIKKVVVAAVRFSNRDVNNFGEKDPGRFLDNTWKLLPETNPELRVRGLYTIRNYSIALMKMEGFLSHLAAEDVFNAYDGFPRNDEYSALIERTDFNLKTARTYLGIKMLTAGVLLALADLTGGDAPLAFFMGGTEPDDSTNELSTFLPDTPVCCGRGDSDDDVLFRLFKDGRAQESQFDLKNSPLSLFLYRSLDDSAIANCTAAAREYFAGNTGPQDYLSVVPGHLVSAIAAAASHVAFTRKNALAQLAADYGENTENIENMETSDV